MTKIFLPLLFPLTVSMAIDFTMTPSGITAPIDTNPTTEETPSSTPIATSTKANPYLEEVTLPSCDASNPEVQFIRSNADWSTINRSDKRIFCVSPGDYRSLRHISLTASGTAEKRRYIILNNGNDTHPGKLDKSQLANFSLTLSYASYWTIDRASFFDTEALKEAYTFSPHATHNILNRAFTDHVARSVLLREDAHNNTIQNSRFQNMTDAYRRADNPAIIFWGSPSSFEIKNTKIIGNEIYNCNDGIMPMIYEKNGKWQDANAEGTIIDSNDIYIDSKLYTDGHGHYSPTGTKAYAENAIDLKMGSHNASNPMIVSNNRLWGYRQSDNTNSLLSDFGSALVIHFGVGNLKVENNLIFDSNDGIFVSDKRTFPYALYNSSFTNNIIHDSGSMNSSNDIHNSMFIGSSNHIRVQDNLISHSRGPAMNFQYNGSDFYVADNVYLNCEATMFAQNNSQGTYRYPTSTPTNYTQDLVFTTDNFTTHPKEIVLKGLTAQ